MKEVFGAVLSVKDNVSGVMKQAKESTRGYRGEVEKTKKELEKLDKKKIREKELKIKNSEAYKAIEGVKKKLQPLAKKTIEIQAKTEHAVDKVKKVKSQLDKIKSTKVVQLVVKGGQKAMKAMGKGMLTGTAAALGAFTIAAGAAGRRQRPSRARCKMLARYWMGMCRASCRGCRSNSNRYPLIPEQPRQTLRMAYIKWCRHSGNLRSP